MAWSSKRLRQPTSRSVENIRIGPEGVYQIDLDSLMKGSPVVYKTRDGVYRIDISPSPKIA